MLLQSLGALWYPLRGPGSIWKYLDALVRAAGVSGRFACGFQTDLNFADVILATGVSKREAKRSLPHLENERQSSVNYD
jgi:hypothetical protein